MGVELLKTFFDEGSGGLSNIPDSSEESVRIAVVALSHLRQRRGEILPTGRLYVRRGNPGDRGTVHVHEGPPYGKFDLCGCSWRWFDGKIQVFQTDQGGTRGDPEFIEAWCFGEFRPQRRQGDDRDERKALLCRSAGDGVVLAGGLDLP